MRCVARFLQSAKLHATNSFDDDGGKREDYITNFRISALAHYSFKLFKFISSKGGRKWQKKKQFWHIQVV